MGFIKSQGITPAPDLKLPICKDIDRPIYLLEENVLCISNNLKVKEWIKKLKSILPYKLPCQCLANINFDF